MQNPSTSENSPKIGMKFIQQRLEIFKGDDEFEKVEKTKYLEMAKDILTWEIPEQIKQIEKLDEFLATRTFMHGCKFSSVDLIMVSLVEFLAKNKSFNFGVNVKRWSSHIFQTNPSIFGDCPDIFQETPLNFFEHLPDENEITVIDMATHQIIWQGASSKADTKEKCMEIYAKSCTSDVSHLKIFASHEDGFREMKFDEDNSFDVLFVGSPADFSSLLESGEDSTEKRQFVGQDRLRGESVTKWLCEQAINQIYSTSQQFNTSYELNRRVHRVESLLKNHCANYAAKGGSPDNLFKPLYGRLERMGYSLKIELSPPTYDTLKDFYKTENRDAHFYGFSSGGLKRGYKFTSKKQDSPKRKRRYHGPSQISI